MIIHNCWLVCFAEGVLTDGIYSIQYYGPGQCQGMPLYMFYRNMNVTTEKRSFDTVGEYLSYSNNVFLQPTGWIGSQPDNWTVIAADSAASLYRLQPVRFLKTHDHVMHIEFNRRHVVFPIPDLYSFNFMFRADEAE